jgi:hypothetical protein
MKPLTQSALEQEMAGSNGGIQTGRRLADAISNRPWARFSLEAEKQIERATRPRLGRRGTIQQGKAEVEEPTDGRCLTICEERSPAEDLIYSPDD